jgi:hypothetical protein
VGVARNVRAHMKLEFHHMYVTYAKKSKDIKLRFLIAECTVEISWRAPLGTAAQGGGGVLKCSFPFHASERMYSQNISIILLLLCMFPDRVCAFRKELEGLSAFCPLLPPWGDYYNLLFEGECLSYSSRSCAHWATATGKEFPPRCESQQHFIDD